MNFYEIIVLSLMLVFIALILIKGTTIVIKVEHQYPKYDVVEDNLYDKNGDAKEEELEDYFEDVLKEVHALMQEDNVDE